MSEQDLIKAALAEGERRAENVLEFRRGQLAVREAAITRARAEAPVAHVERALAPQAFAAAGSPPRGVLVAEGDSWFDYPMTDALRVLEDQFGYDVESVAHRGDRVEDMAYGDGQLEELTRTIEKLLRRRIEPRALARDVVERRGQLRRILGERAASDAGRVRAGGATAGGGALTGRHRQAIHAAAATSRAPLTRALCIPNGASFSNATKAVSAAITARFITPPAKSSSISAQQQPTQ
jgi:hypothetical protein